ncbi:MAG: hypothetical protein U1E73_07510 [Planctomycetota bacterium]
MGRIVFAAPELRRFHLHDRLRRRLQEAGFDVHALHIDPVAHALWQTHRQVSELARPAAADPGHAPIAEFAALELRRLGLPDRARAHIERRLARLAPAIAAALDRLAPDLVFLVGPRTAERRLCHFLARERGVRVLWSAQGLLPHTMQVDPAGIDGEAASTRWPASAHRRHRADANLLAGGLAHLLARDHPIGVARCIVHAPPWSLRLGAAAGAALRGEPRGVAHAFAGWRAALRGHRPQLLPIELPTSPFVAVLLQADDDERVRLDAEAPPTQPELIGATVGAARALDPALHVVVVAPPRGLDAEVATACAVLPRLTVVPAHVAGDAAATALATTTINHPLGLAALLAGGPLLHTGRALYGLSPVTCRAPIEAFGKELRIALAEDDVQHLRERFLTWLLDAGHVWCSEAEPSFNGLLGLSQTLELHTSCRWPKGLGLRYRRGPAWPLTYGATDA